MSGFGKDSGYGGNGASTAQDLIEVSKQIKQRLFDDRDASAACDFLADDATWEIVPYAFKSSGREEICKSMANFVGWIQDGRFEFVSAMEGVDKVGELSVRKVCMERISHFKAEDKWFAVHVCDIMTFNDEGKVTTWREYHTLDYLKEIKNPPF